MKNKLFVINLLVFFALFAFGCQPNQTILNDRQPTPSLVENTPEKIFDDFEDRLKSVQTGNFEFIYVVRRKDSDVFSSEDKKYLRETLPPDTNQKQLTSDEKALIVGSNYVFPSENLDALKKRFKIEDHSPKNDEPKTEQNTNVNR